MSTAQLDGTRPRESSAGNRYQRLPWPSGTPGNLPEHPHLRSASAPTRREPAGPPPVLIAEESLFAVRGPKNLPCGIGFRDSQFARSSYLEPAPAESLFDPARHSRRALS